MSELFDIPETRPSELQLARARFEAAQAAYDAVKLSDPPDTREEVEREMGRARIELTKAERREVDRLKS